MSLSRYKLQSFKPLGQVGHAMKQNWAPIFLGVEVVIRPPGSNMVPFPVPPPSFPHIHITTRPLCEMRPREVWNCS